MGRKNDKRQFAEQVAGKLENSEKEEMWGNFCLLLLKQPFCVGVFDDDKTERWVITDQKQMNNDRLIIMMR